MIRPKKKYCHTDDRRRAIAAAARAIIVEKGFEGLRTREIAERVGINIATLHYHVPTKETLIQLVAESMRDDFVAQNANNPRDGLSARQQLAAQIGEHRDLVLNNPQLLQVMGELSRRALHDDNIARHLLPMRQGWMNQFIAILQLGIADGSFRSNLDPAAAAHVIVGALVTFQQSQAQTDFYDSVVAELFRSILSFPKEEPSHD
jgi:AcrR family transcriptional regulator